MHIKPNSTIQNLEKLYTWIIKIGLCLITFLPLYISSSMLFPYITGRTFLFRIMVEIIFSLWLVLAICNPKFRPKMTILFTTITIFIAIVFIADLLSFNPQAAFFSNYERMEGFMTIFHLYLYWMVLVGILKQNKDWLLFFHSTLAVSVVIAIQAVYQRLALNIERVDSTLGNPIYLAAYALFHVGLLLMLIYQSQKNPNKKIVLPIYYLILLLQISIIVLSLTRGVVLSLVVVSIFCLLSSIVFWKKFQTSTENHNLPHLQNKILSTNNQNQAWPLPRLGLVIFLISIVLLITGLIYFRNTEFIKSNSTLYRLTNYSLADSTITPRIMVWKMAWKGFLEQPFLGYGQENYYLVFQKHFDPNLEGHEAWFDRAHSIVFDWLINAGILGLLSYLSIFIVAILLLLYNCHKSKIHIIETMILIGLFSSYLIQNLFVFDNFNIYILFFAFLAYTQYRTSDGEETLSIQTATTSQRPVYHYTLLTIIFFLTIIYAGIGLHFKPILQSKSLILALQSYRKKQPMENIIAKFQSALKYNSFGNTETRKHLWSTTQDAWFEYKLNPTSSPYSKNEIEQLLIFTNNELEQENKIANPNAAYMLLQGSTLNMLAQINPNINNIKKSEKILLEANLLSPKKQLIYLELIKLYSAFGHNQAAADMAKHTWYLNKKYLPAAIDVWTTSLRMNDQKSIQEVKNEIGKSIDITAIDSQTLNVIRWHYNQAQLKNKTL